MSYEAQKSSLKTYQDSIKSISGCKEYLYPYVTGSLAFDIMKQPQYENARKGFIRDYQLRQYNIERNGLEVSNILRLMAYSMNVPEEIKYKTYAVLVAWLSSPVAPTRLGCVLDAEKFVKTIENSLYREQIPLLDNYIVLGNMLQCYIFACDKKAPDDMKTKIMDYCKQIINTPDMLYTTPTSKPSDPKNWEPYQLSSKIRNDSTFNISDVINEYIGNVSVKR